MMGGGVCWLDYDNDGWLDLYVVNSYADLDIPKWQESGGMPRNALFHNENGPLRRRQQGIGRGSRSSAATAASPPTSTATGAPIST